MERLIQREEESDNKGGNADARRALKNDRQTWGPAFRHEIAIAERHDGRGREVERITSPRQRRADLAAEAVQHQRIAQEESDRPQNENEDDACGSEYRQP